MLRLFIEIINIEKRVCGLKSSCRFKNIVSWPNTNPTGISAIHIFVNCWKQKNNRPTNESNTHSSIWYCYIHVVSLFTYKSASSRSTCVIRIIFEQSSKCHYCTAIARGIRCPQFHACAINSLMNMHMLRIIITVGRLALTKKTTTTNHTPKYIMSRDPETPYAQNLHNIIELNWSLSKDRGKHSIRTVIISTHFIRSLYGYTMGCEHAAKACVSWWA